MQVVINQLSVKTSNEIHVLNGLSKGKILSLLVNHLQAPDRFVLSLASDVDALETPEPAKDLVTLSEWLEIKNIELTKSDLHKLAGLVAKNYRELYNESPRVITRPDSRGRWLKKANGFTEAELPILEKALKEVRRRNKQDNKPNKLVLV